MASKDNIGSAPTGDRSLETGAWDAALNQLREWDPEWAETCVKMTTNPWTSTVLPRKTVELIGVALNAACTNLNPEGTRRHIRAALRAGASREEILLVLKMASVLAIHSCSLGAPFFSKRQRRRELGHRQNRRSQRPPATRYARSANGMTRGIRLSSSIQSGPTNSWQRARQFTRAN